MRGKLILIEGTDCSGKQTQTELLTKKLKEDNREIINLSFPMYDTPTGKIIGGPYLGKKAIGGSWFSEGATNVEAKVASLYYAADRLYNVRKLTDALNAGIDVILDRYTMSNMAHQAGKIMDTADRYVVYKWIHDLEFEFLELPKPDYSILLYMPYEYGAELRNNREEQLDEHERSEDHLRNAQAAYLEVADLYDFDIINCVKDEKIRSIEDINNELYDKVLKMLEPTTNI